MARKQDTYYFDQFVACARSACRAARLLERTLQSFDTADLERRLNEMHDIEHEADRTKHEMLSALVKAFITPIEREDIISLSQYIDDIVDQIEDVLIRIYINNVEQIRPEALEFAAVIIECCEATCQVLEEFVHFKHSKDLKEQVVGVNALEEKADRLFISSMRRLHTTCTDPLTILAWREIFTYLEACADACEHVADVVESVVMKNS